MENKTREWNPQTEVAVLKNEIEYLKRRVAALERVNLYKSNSCEAVAGWPTQEANLKWLKGISNLSEEHE